MICNRPVGIVMFYLVGPNRETIVDKEYASRHTPPKSGAGLWRGHWGEEDEPDEGHEIDGWPYVAPEVPLTAKEAAKEAAKAKAKAAKAIAKATAKAASAKAKKDASAKASKAKAKAQSKKKGTPQPAPGKRLNKKTKPAQSAEAGEDDKEEVPALVGSTEEDEDDDDSEEALPKKKRRKKTKKKKDADSEDEEEEEEEGDEKEGLAEEGHDSESDFEPDHIVEPDEEEPIAPGLDEEPTAPRLAEAREPRGDDLEMLGSEPRMVRGDVGIMEPPRIEDVQEPWCDRLKVGHLVQVSGMVSWKLNGSVVQVTEVENDEHLLRALVKEIPESFRLPTQIGWLPIKNLTKLGLKDSMPFFKADVTIGDDAYKLRGTPQGDRNPIILVKYRNEDGKEVTLGGINCKPDNGAAKLWKVAIAVMSSLNVAFERNGTVPTKDAFATERDRILSEIVG